MTLPVSKKASHPEILRVFDLTAHAVCFYFFGRGRKKQRAIDRANEAPFSGDPVHVT